MKKGYLLTVLIVALGGGACNNTGSNTPAGDSATDKTIPAPVDNNNATNPSLADTAYPKKDTMQTRGDSARRAK